MKLEEFDSSEVRNYSNWARIDLDTERNKNLAIIQKIFQKQYNKTISRQKLFSLCIDNLVEDLEKLTSEEEIAEHIKKLYQKALF